MHQQNHNKNKIHEPVLLALVMQYLEPKVNDSYLDLTAGYGGHAQAIINKTRRPDKAVLVDRDQTAIDYLTKLFGTKSTIIHDDFVSAAQQIKEQKQKFNIILADLGVSSLHLNQSERGFAIKHNGPLDMRMDIRQTLTAATIVNNYSESELANILKRYGEEPKAKQIAKLIVNNRPLMTTVQLADIVAQAWPGFSRINPATRTFQALRIAVNNELELLAKAIPIWMDLLEKNGRLAIISFHSLEDRIVKQSFAEYSGDRYDALLQLLTKHPLVASSQELVFNPRSRSAKLRVVVKK